MGHRTEKERSSASHVEGSGHPRALSGWRPQALLPLEKLSNHSHGVKGKDYYRTQPTFPLPVVMELA